LINLDWEFTGSDGSRHHVSLYDATEQQAAVVSWLRAEQAWKTNNEWQAKELARKAKEKRKAAERAATVVRLRANHEALLARLPSYSFRHAIVERHGPTSVSDYRGLLACRTCDDGSRYEPEALPFPCPEYTFAQDWDRDE
jgi:hypothetical protein